MRQRIQTGGGQNGGRFCGQWVSPERGEMMSILQKGGRRYVDCRNLTADLKLVLHNTEKSMPDAKAIQDLFGDAYRDGIDIIAVAESGLQEHRPEAICAEP